MIDLEREHLLAHQALCRAMHSDFAQLPPEFGRRSGTRIIDDIREMRAFFGWSVSEEELLAQRQQFFDEICRNAKLELMPGVERVVRELHARGLKLAVTSAAVRTSIEWILERVGLHDLFTLIVDGGDVERGKPDPESYLLTAQKLGVAPNTCVVFEDSHVGVLAAKAAGMYCVAVRNPHATVRQDLSAADQVLASFAELQILQICAKRRHA